MDLNRIKTVSSVSVNKKITEEKNEKQEYKAIYSREGKITSENGDATYLNSLTKENGDKQKFIAIYDMREHGGGVTYEKNNRQVYRTGPGADRLFNKKIQKIKRNL
jgi:hypothetical protein